MTGTQTDSPARVLQTLDFRLTYADTDPLGIIFYAAYFPWMERTYNEWVYSTGLTNDETIRRWGVNSIMRSSGCDYFVPGVLFDALTCGMRLSRVGNSSYRLAFDFHRRSDETLLATGIMNLVMVNRNREPTKVPDEFVLCLRGEA